MTIPESTTGGMRCQICGMAYRLETGHYCAGSVPNSNLPLVGWTCPTCGRGNAPWVQTCPHPLRSTTGAGRA